MTSHEQRVGDLAQRQHGLITHQQALDLGMSQSQIQRRVTAGRWRREHRGVYRLAGAPSSWEQATLAACWAAPAPAVASYLSAAALAGLRSPPLLPHITVPYGRSARLPAAVVHRTRLHPLDAGQFAGIPTTSMPRMLVDCASVSRRGPLQSLVDGALHEGLATVREVELAIERAGPRPGRRTLTALLEPWRCGVRPDSPAEMRLVRLIVSWGYPPPERQIRIRDADGVLIARADLGWSARRVGIEYDSGRWHGPSAWSHDEARHLAVTATGWTLLHADKTDLRPGERSLRDQLAAVWPVAPRRTA